MSSEFPSTRENRIPIPGMVSIFAFNLSMSFFGIIGKKDEMLNDYLFSWKLYFKIASKSAEKRKEYLDTSNEYSNGPNSSIYNFSISLRLRFLLFFFSSFIHSSLKLNFLYFIKFSITLLYIAVPPKDISMGIDKISSALQYAEKLASSVLSPNTVNILL